jgi:hypothetical protein
MFKKARSLELGVGAVASLVVLVAASACSSDEKCDESRTCAGPSAPAEAGAGGEPGSGQAGAGATSTGGAGAQDGTAGEGGGTQSGTAGEGGGMQIGTAGAGGMAECAVDDDCDDGLFCNGAEQCVNGACEAGAEPCAVADPDHCQPTCDEGASAAVCGIEARDADGDGHGDQECAVPGDDCDDSEADGTAIHPDAGEICNAGVDDDCDGADESTDEVVLAGSSEVLVAAIGATERDHVSIAAIPDGGFGVVWADWRAGTKQNVFYRQLLANGTPGNELQLTTSATYYDNDYPDIVVTASSPGEFYVAHHARKVADSDGLMLRVEVAFDGSSKENEGTIAEPDTRPQVCPDVVYLLDGTDKRAVFCALSGAGCGSWGAQPDEFYFADAFHVSPMTNRLVYEQDGNLFVRDLVNTSPGAVAESVSENRTNALITEDGSDTLLAYRYDDGIRVGSCEFDDGIPVDLATTGSASALLYWNPAQTALYVRVVSPDCSTSPSALVALEDGTSIGSAALAVDSDGVIAVVWSSENTNSGEWTIMSRVFSPALCE